MGQTGLPHAQQTSGISYEPPPSHRWDLPTTSSLQSSCFWRPGSIDYTPSFSGSQHLVDGHHTVLVGIDFRRHIGTRGLCVSRPALQCPGLCSQGEPVLAGGRDAHPGITWNNAEQVETRTSRGPSWTLPPTSTPQLVPPGLFPVHARGWL